MISINKNGWLHKFNSFFSSDMSREENSTLCAYFWNTIWNISKAVFFIAIIVGITGLAGCTILAPLIGVPFAGAFYTLGYLAYLSPLVGSLAISLVFGIFFGATVGVGWSWNKLSIWLSTKTEDVNIKTPEALVLALEFAKAKKKKYCPLVKIE